MKGYCKCGVKFDESNSALFTLERGFGKCRNCNSVYMRKYNAENNEKVAKKNKENYLKNADRYRGYRKSYYVNHKEERLAWYKKHRATPRARHTQVKEALRKELIPATDPLWGLNYYAELIKDGICHYCLGPLNQSSHALDRMDNNSPHACWNVVPSCWWCNERKKADLSYEEMMLLVPALREIRRRRELSDVGKIVRDMPSSS